MKKLASVVWPDEKLERLSIQAKNARIRLQLTQKEAAAQIGVPYDSIRRFETGKSPTPHAYKIIEFFGLKE